jgi:hypothetical protein
MPIRGLEGSEMLRIGSQLAVRLSALRTGLTLLRRNTIFCFWYSFLSEAGVILNGMHKGGETPRRRKGWAVS